MGAKQEAKRMSKYDLRPYVFVLMPFSKDFDDVYRLGIKATAEEVGLRAERVDEQLYSESMLERIYQQIGTADIIVADMTGQNPNVFYEVGYAHAKGKLCILLTQNASDIPFDLKQHRHIVYGGSIAGLKESLGANLHWAVGQVSAQAASGLSVKVSPKPGDLTLTKYTAKASVRLLVDIHNVTETSFGEVEAVHIYLGKGWTFSQNGQVCPKTSSDLQHFEERHAFTPPMRRINPQGWAQVIAVGEKTVQNVFNGGELKNSYTISGRLLVRVVTASRHYDFESTLSVEVEDLPF